jgi:hypothetical protein
MVETEKPISVASSWLVLPSTSAPKDQDLALSQGSQPLSLERFLAVEAPEVEMTDRLLNDMYRATGTQKPFNDFKN